MKKLFVIVLLLAPAASFAQEAEFLRDASFYCRCIISKPGDVTYNVTDTAFVTFYKDNSTAEIETEHYGMSATAGFEKRGPWLKFADDCVSQGSGTAFLGLIRFSFKDECSDLVYSCRGHRYFRKRPQ